MPSYVTESQFQAWAGKQVSATDPGQLDQVTGKVDGTTYDSGEATDAVARASQLVDSYLKAGGISLPLTDTDALKAVELPTLRLALWDLILIHPAGDNVLARAQAMRDDSISWLEGIAANDIELPGDLGTDDTNATADSQERLYTTDAMRLS